MNRIIFKLYIVWFIVGLVLVSFDLIPSWLEWANSVFLILAGVIALFYAMATFGRIKGLILSVLIGVSTFLIEGLSAHFDVFFGNYDYTERFPPLLFGVPIGIAFAWIVMIMAGHALSRKFSNRFLRATIAALYVVALDFVLDPVAFVSKSYWVWYSDSDYYGIPLSNFIGWFIIAFVWQLILSVCKANHHKELSTQIQIVFWTIVILFITLAFVALLFKAIIWSLILLLILEVVRRWSYEKI